MAWLRDTSRSVSLEIGAGVAMMLTLLPAHAAKIDTGSPDFSLHWDTTVQLSTAFRLKSQNPLLISDLNEDDGDRNFNKGLISDRLDILSELDLDYKRDYGLRISGAGWYDPKYLEHNDNDSPTTANNESVAYNQFNSEAQRLHGRHAEVLDAFVYANGHVGDMASNVRLGRHSLLYGESLFFGNNGIAGGQSPIDAIKLLSVPNSQFKEIIRPVDQLSGQLQVLSNVAIGAYYQFEWDKTRIPSAGSYFSGADILDGGERFLLGSVDPTTRQAPAWQHVADQDAKNSGQGGVQVRWRPEIVDVELGFYAIRYNDKTPQGYFYAGPPGVGTYQLAYAEGVRAYGMSFSTEVGDANVAGEFSTRDNAPLVSDPVIVTSGTPDNNHNPGYAVGKTAHGQLSTIYIAKPTMFFDNATFLGEIAWNRRLSVTKNPQAVAINSTRDAWALRLIFEPAWFQVKPGLDLSAPIGLGWSGHGASSAVTQFNAGGAKGGDLSLGLKGTYEQTWRFGLNYTHYLGAAGLGLVDTHFTFKQSLADRDFVSLSVQRSF